MAELTVALPNFVLEGYAVYGDRSIFIPTTGETINNDNYKGLDFIGVRSDAPQWAKDEYEQWGITQNQAKSNNEKL